MTSRTKKIGRRRESRDGKSIRKLRNVRYSDAEWAWIKKEATAENLTIAGFIRHKSLSGMNYSNPSAEY